MNASKATIWLLAATWILILPARGQELSGGGPRAFSTRCETCSPGAARRLLDHTAARAVILLGYTPEEGQEADAGKGSTLAGVTTARHLRARGLEGMRRLDIAVSRHPVSGYEFLVHGDLEVDGEERPNPDLPEIHQLLDEMTTALAADGAERSPDFEVEVIQLSFVQSDRVLGLLKALGYTTVEYSKEEAEGSYERIFTPIQAGEWILPAIVKLEDSSKTSLLQPGGEAEATESTSTVPQMGGTFLHDSTTSDPLQRLLIAYDPDDRESFDKLLAVIRDRLDVPAAQVVIEALVMQVSRNAVRDLGVNYMWVDGRNSASFSRDQAGNPLPFSYQYDDALPGGLSRFIARLHALVGSGEGQILSNPSVLVLDGRQARLQIGQQIPVVTSTVSVGVIEESVEYFPVGIVLNLRPRISADGSEVSMQVETIVSSVSQSESTQAGGTDTRIFVAPVVSNVQVQTLVRVADNTPFVIGGMIIESLDDRKRGLPGLSKIPGLGALFRRREKKSLKSEVLIVLTPHVVRQYEGTESLVDPANSHAYRVVTEVEGDR